MPSTKPHGVKPKDCNPNTETPQDYKSLTDLFYISLVVLALLGVLLGAESQVSVNVDDDAILQVFLDIYVRCMIKQWELSVKRIVINPRQLENHTNSNLECVLFKTVIVS